jgi:hypothetical protein
LDVLALGLARVADALEAALPMPAAVDLLSATGRVSDFLLLPGCFRGDSAIFDALAVAFALLVVAFVMMPQAQVLQAYKCYALWNASLSHTNHIVEPTIFESVGGAGTMADGHDTSG